MASKPTSSPTTTELLQDMRDALHRMAPSQDEVQSTLLVDHRGPTSGLTVTSQVYLTRGPYNAVVVHAIPTPDSSGNASAVLTVIDSDAPNVRYTVTVDAAGNVGTITAETVKRVMGVRPYVKVKISVSAGTWDVYATPVNVGNESTVTATIGSGTITAQPTQASGTDRSGTMATGGTAQTLMAANSSRKYFFVQNQSNGDLWIDWTATAVQGEPSIKVASGAAYENPPHFCPTGAISIIGATTGQAFSAKEA